MIFYFLIFLKSLTFDFLQSRIKSLGFIFFIFSFFVLLFFIGFRYNVGGDFGIYEEYFYFNYSAERNFYLFDLIFNIFRYNKIPFNFLLFTISLFCLYSLYNYSLNYKSFFLVLFASMPIIITILFMGYLKQGISFAFLLFALNSLYKKKNYQYYLYIILGSLFHLSLIIFLPLKLLVETQFNFKQIVLRIIFLIILTFIIYYIFYNELIIFIQGYLIDDTLISSGSIYRITINLLCGFVYVFSIKRIDDNLIIRKIFIFFFIASIVLFISNFYFPVFADRMNYYLIPLQLHLVGKIEKLFKTPIFLFISRSLVVILYFSIYLVWFNFGTFSHVWKNYDICLINCTSLKMKTDICYLTQKCK